MIDYKCKAHNQTVARSPKTAQQYNESLNPATDGCRAEGCPPTWTTRGEDEVREFILYNQDRRGLWREIVLHIRESEERASGRFHLDVPPEQHRGAPPPRTGASGRYRKSDRTLNPRANRYGFRQHESQHGVGRTEHGHLLPDADTGLRLFEVVRQKDVDVHLEDRYCRSIIPIRDKSSSRVLLGRWNRLERLMPNRAHWHTADQEGCLSSTISRRFARLCFLGFFMSDSS